MNNNEIVAAVLADPAQFQPKPNSLRGYPRDLFQILRQHLTHREIAAALGVSVVNVGCLASHWGLTTPRAKGVVKELPSADYLRACFDYEPETGVLRWKERPLGHFASKRAWKAWNTRNAGTEAGRIIHLGYRLVRLGAQFYAHRLIWALVTGEDPGRLQIDHINGDTSDNRWDNLRLVTHSENQKNRKDNFRRGNDSTGGVL